MQFLDNFQRKASGFFSSLSVKHFGIFKRKPKGEIFVTIHHTDTGKVEKKLLCNIVTRDASTLLARLVKDPTDPIAGVAYFVVGSGGDGWNPLNPPSAEDTQEALETELARVPVAFSRFINPLTGLESLTPTHIVDFDFTLTETEGNGYLVECGLTGGDATGTPYSGTLITYKTFPVISKTATMIMNFTYRLTF